MDTPLYFTFPLTVHYPDANRPTNVVTTSSLLSRYLELMSKNDILEGICAGLLYQFSEHRTSVCKVPLRFTTFDFDSKAPTDNKELVTTLASLTTSLELTQIHLSVWDHVYRDASMQIESAHYRKLDFVIDEQQIELVTLSERIAHGWMWRNDRGILYSWLADTHAQLSHPLSIVTDQSFAPGTPVVISRCNRPTPSHSIYHMATTDALQLI